MRRTIALVGFALFALLVTRPVAAQQYGGMAGNLADTYAKEGKEQLSRAKRYSAARSSKSYMSGPASTLHFNPAVDASGRIDMSGHAPPSFYKLRDPKSRLSHAPTGSRASAAHGRPAPWAKYAPAPRPALKDFTATSSRRSSLPPIPPPPL